MILPDAEWYMQNTGENFYDHLSKEDRIHKSVFYLEQCFPLKNDPHLPDGVLCSIVEWSANPFYPLDTLGPEAQNKLKLMRCGTDKEGYISCVHTPL